MSDMSNHSDLNVKIVHGDSLDVLDTVVDGSVQLVITSPPYNIGKSYEKDTKMSLDDYIEWLRPIIEKICIKVADGGSVCWQTGNFVRDGEIFPLDIFFYQLFIKCGFKLRNRIIWRFNFGLHASNRFSGRYETILWFTKGSKYTFNLDPVRVPQLYPGKRHASTKAKDKAGKPSGNPKGKNPADFWTFSADEAFFANPIWELPNVKAGHPEKTVHPCQFPHELAERCILALSNPGDLILDPFIGAGTSAIAAIKAGRRIIGIDKSEEYVSLTIQRLAALETGELALRESGKEIRAPKTGERVSTAPAEWTQGRGDG
ncbi:DNA-methyltransferase [Sphingomonas sanguinis]|uniref:Methyltransferase n=1 Tax=Sphingomonas sanguinis TaxID=33051 RepID=A0A147JC19_9SPHN|nr:site-specific DNA-methyltransferase [Sphingomonas sanguinis]KTW17133.1 DNA methyltransferase [Sphingomonas sanguinis]